MFMNSNQQTPNRRVAMVHLLAFLATTSILSYANASDSSDQDSYISKKHDNHLNAAIDHNGNFALIFDAPNSQQVKYSLLWKNYSIDTPDYKSLNATIDRLDHIHISADYKPPVSWPFRAPIIQGQFTLSHRESVSNITVITVNSNGVRTTNCIAPYQNERHITGDFTIIPK